MGRKQCSGFAVLACAYAGYVLIATFYPFEFSWTAGRPLAQGFPEFFTLPGRIDVAQNLLLFIPFGALLLFSLAPERTRSVAILLTTVIAALFSSGIELLQFSFSRTPSVFDIVSNICGAALGSGAAALVPRRLIASGSGLLARNGVLAIGLMLAIGLGAIPLVSSVVQWSGPFRIWNFQFSFQIGNEPTLNRPWLGKLYSVAIYDRSLDEEEVRRVFRRGHAAPGTRRGTGPIALYSFRESQGNVAHDTSGVEPALDLFASPPDRVRWLGSGGIEIAQPAVLRSRNSGKKLVEALRKSGELSVEIWLAPHNTRQEGPARIVSLSRNTGTRNFTVGQQGANIQFRLRTPATGRNGAPLALTTTTDFLSTELAHIVVTYKDGIQRVYANGAEQGRLDLTRQGIIGFGTKATALARLAYAFFYFYPLSFLLSLFASRRFTRPWARLLWPAGIAGGLLAVTEAFQAFAFARELDPALLFIGLAVVLAGAVTGGTGVRLETHSAMR